MSYLNHNNMVKMTILLNRYDDYFTVSRLTLEDMRFTNKLLTTVNLGMV